jgi:hypothetical protein
VGSLLRQSLRELVDRLLPTGERESKLKKCVEEHMLDVQSQIKLRQERESEVSRCRALCMAS